VSKHRSFILWTAVLVTSGVVQLVWGPVDQFLARLSPLSIWQLPPAAKPAILATLVASVVAWLAAVVVGGLLGMITAVGGLAEREHGRVWKAWSAVATTIRRAFTWLYVVPLVLTISAVTTVLLKLELEDRLSQPAVGILLVAVSGIALAGQRIFVAIDDAVGHASTDDIMLASSVFLGSHKRPTGIVHTGRRLWQEARFLLSCRISLLGQALEQAFHLAVVGVVILETVSGLRVYEKLFPQEANVLPWGGGIGRLIIDGQNATNPVLVAGSVWLILILDSLIAWGIHEATYRRWVLPYRRMQ
jgi:hypothetical protein